VLQEATFLVVSLCGFFLLLVTEIIKLQFWFLELKKYMPGGGMLVKKICQGSAGEQKKMPGGVCLLVEKMATNTMNRGILVTKICRGWGSGGYKNILGWGVCWLKNMPGVYWILS
jgi:hypothetical protein